MSPNLRRALHQALDIVCDALAEEGRTVKKRAARGPAAPLPPSPTRALTDEEQAQLDRQLRRNGYRKTG